VPPGLKPRGSIGNGGRGTGLDRQLASRECLDAEDEERRRGAGQHRGDGREDANSGQFRVHRHGHRRWRGELSRGHRHRGRLCRLDLAAITGGSHGGLAGRVGSVAATGGRLGIASWRRAAMAEAQPGRGVQQRQGERRHPESPYDLPHGLSISMDRRRAECNPLPFYRLQTAKGARHHSRYLAPLPNESRIPSPESRVPSPYPLNPSGSQPFSYVRPQSAWALGSLTTWPFFGSHRSVWPTR